MTTEFTKSTVREYFESIVIAVILALFIRTFVVQAFKIPSGSMRPTLLEGDKLFVNKYVYRFNSPERGDIIVFKYPVDPKKDFIKRLVALSGDEVEIAETGLLGSSENVSTDAAEAVDGDAGGHLMLLGFRRIYV